MPQTRPTVATFQKPVCYSQSWRQRRPDIATKFKSFKDLPVYKLNQVNHGYLQLFDICLFILSRTARSIQLFLVSQGVAKIQPESLTLRLVLVASLLFFLSYTIATASSNEIENSVLYTTCIECTVHVMRLSHSEMNVYAMASWQIKPVLYMGLEFSL